MNLLHLDSSALGEGSVTRALSAAVVARLRTQHPAAYVVYRDLDAAPLRHLTAATLATPSPDEAQVLEEFLQADVVVIGVPMYNFGIPSTLKAWVDRIAVAGKTFRYTEQGPEGLAQGKRIIIASGRGGLYDQSPADFQEPYLAQLFAFLGIPSIEVVRAEGVAYSPEHRQQALEQAQESINALAA
jgi:FMN-dependent NADH-azoreductase